MTVQGINTINLTQNSDNTESVQDVNQQRRPPGPPPKDGQGMNDRFTMSPMGQLFGQVIQQYGDTAKSELQDFGLLLQQNLHEGTFDATTLTEQAPESLKSLVEELGINFEEMLNDLQQHFEEMRQTMQNGFPGQQAMQAGNPVGEPAADIQSILFGEENKSE